MEGIAADVDYRKIAEAMDFYIERGYTNIKVPWVVSEEADQITGKGLPQVRSLLGNHVASAEQSYLQLIIDRQLSPGKYVACTPCFRDDPPGEYYDKGFMKVELIHYLGVAPHREVLITEVVEDARSFLARYGPVETRKTKEGFDLTLDGIEVGSYGARTHKEFSWIYGTGIAEPRFSYCIKKKRRGYHLRDIAKGELGTVSKIYEEVEELRDALSQKNEIMGLIELSDTLGAIESYLETRFKGTLTLDDLLTMKDATKRAFRSGRR